MKATYCVKRIETEEQTGPRRGNREFSPFSLRPPVQSSLPYLRQPASICGQFRIPFWLAALRSFWLQGLLFYALTVLSVSAQIQQAWVAPYNNGMTNGTNQAVNMVLDPAGNIYVTGFSQNTNSQLGYITAKYAPNGTQLWAARYDLTNCPSATPSALVLDNSNNVIVTGSALTVKYDSNGNQLWTAPYSGSALAVDTNRNLYVTGFGTNFNTVKLNPMGNNLWLRTYQDAGPTIGQAIAVDNNGNAYVVGSDVTFYWFNNYSWVPQVALVASEYTSTGTQAWIANYGYEADVAQVTARGIALDSANNLYVLASSPDIFSAYLTIKFGTNGSLSWVLYPTAVGSVGFAGNANGLTLDNKGNVLLTGQVVVILPGGNIYDGPFIDSYGTYKASTNGLLVWSSHYPMVEALPSAGLAIAVDAANNCYVTGFSPGTNSGSDIVTIKYDDHGNQIWLERYSGPGNGDDEGNAIAVDASANVYVTGYETTAAGGTEMVTIKYAPGPFLTKQANGNFLLQAAGSAGQVFDFQASTNLQTWQELGTNTADTNGTVQFLDTNALSFPSRFYLATPQ